MKQNSRVNIRVTDKLKQEIALHVAKKEKNISAYVTRLIEKDLKGNA